MHYIVRIALNRVVQIHLHPKRVQTTPERVRPALPCVLRDDDAADQQALGAERVNQAKDVFLVSNAKIATNLILLNGRGVDWDHDLRAVLQLEEHPDFAVRFKSGQNARGMEVVKKLAAEFQIELAAELVNAFPDARGLGLQILLIVKANGFHTGTPLSNIPR